MNGHDTDPTPPHGTERPPLIAEHYVSRMAPLATSPDDRAALDALAEMADTLSFAVRLSKIGTLDLLAEVLTEAGRLWFGWKTCPYCDESTHPDDWDERGFCFDCRDAAAVPCAICDATGGLLNSESVCVICEEAHDDDESAPLPFTPCPACAEIVDALVEGVCRECHDCGLRSLAPCEFGHFDCATEEGGRCANLRAALDRVGEIIEANADRLSAVLDDDDPSACVECGDPATPGANDRRCETCAMLAD